MSKALSVSEADCATSSLPVPTLTPAQIHNFLRMRHDSPALALAGFVQVPVSVSLSLSLSVCTCVITRTQTHTRVSTNTYVSTWVFACVCT